MKCCGSVCCDATERHFRQSVAKRDLRRYNREGPDATTRLLLAALRESAVFGASLLDVGGGVGVLCFELLSAGVSRATLAEASPAYLDAARREAERRGRQDQLRFIGGDFVNLAEGIEPADIVTMHRVICCYPAYAMLLTQALGRCLRLFAFTYPRDRWYVRWVFGLENLARRFAGNSFRTFVHPASVMKGMIQEAGFRSVSRRATLAWCIEIYSRTDAA